MAENRTVVGDREFLEVLDPRLWSEVESSARNGNAGAVTQLATTNEAITINFNAPQGTLNTILTRKRARKNTENTNKENQVPHVEFTAGNGSRGT